jgi:hypothetical protein
MIRNCIPLGLLLSTLVIAGDYQPDPAVKYSLVASSEATTSATPAEDRWIESLKANLIKGGAAELLAGKHSILLTERINYATTLLPQRAGRRDAVPSERLHLNVTEGDPGPGVDLQSNVAVRRLPPIRIRVREVCYLLAVQ